MGYDLVKSGPPGGGESVVDPAGYRLLAGASRPQLLFPVSASLPALDSAPDAIAVTYSAGYGEAAESVPAKTTVSAFWTANPNRSRDFPSGWNITMPGHHTLFR